MTIDLEVIIVSFESASSVAGALASIDATLPDAAISIREHGSDPGALDALSALCACRPMIRVEYDATNPGFGAGCNALAMSSDAEWLLFLNPDAEIVSWPWTDMMPQPGQIVGPTMIGGDRPGDHYGTSYRIRDEIARSWFRRSARRPSGRGFVSGAAMLVDAASFRTVGGFDERFFMFYEDIDLCLRANAAGVGTTIHDDWTVRHEGGHSTRSRFAEALVWSYESASRFHAERAGSVRAYRSYVLADSLARAAVHALRGDGKRSAYAALARRAANDLIRST